jgi:hypothetical protein
VATINIANLTFSHKGNYDGSTAYVKNDVVYYATNGNAYIAKQATTGNAPTNGTYWSQFAQGSGGIWNAGLSLGTAGQVVKVNSGASALEFGTLSSDFVFLGSGSGTGASSISVDFFSATYDLYKIFVTGWYGSANGNSTRMRFNSSAGTSATNAVYRGIFTGGYINNSGTVSSNQGTGVWDSGYLNLSNISSNDYEFADHEITVFRPYSSSTKTSCIITGGGFEGNHGYSRQGHAIFNTNMTHTGVTFYAGSGTVTIPYIKVYGLKTS